MSPLESKLRPLLAALDSAALEALASKGLLRRAQKDLERGVPITVEGADSGALHLKVEQFEVSLPEAGPVKATCSCPAAGVCQHILAAILFLQRQGPAAPGSGGEPAAGQADIAAQAEKELLSITREQLETWARKADFRAGFRLALESLTEIESQRGVVIRFPSLNAQCHYVPGGGLEGMIVSGSARDERRLAVAAVVAFQKAAGIAWEPSAELTAGLAAAEGAPRTRAEVLEVSQALLAEMLSNGLARLSPAVQQRLATLAVSAVGVNLPRLSLALRGLADECKLAVTRDARAALDRMLERMAYVHALGAALLQGGANPRPDLVGWYRTRYEEIGHLDLVGVAAWPWRTPSGYEGLTLLFWDAAAKRWCSWSDSRPKSQLKDFNPVARYTQPGPYEGAESPRQLARSGFRLMNARRNGAHRLSSSSKSRVLVTGPAQVASQALPVINDWSRLAQHLDAHASVGLKETNPLDSVLALQPAVWGERGFDPVSQIFSWVLVDIAQRPLLLQLRFDDLTEPAIQFLETVPLASLEQALLIGKLQPAPGGLSVEPYSLHRREGGPLHLALDSAKSAPTPATTSNDPAEEEQWEEEEEWEINETPGSPVARLLLELEDALLAVAESGLAALNPLRVERVRPLVPRAEQMGLKLLAQSLETFVSHPEQPLALLRCAYLVQLHRRASSMGQT